MVIVAGGMAKYTISSLTASGSSYLSRFIIELGVLGIVTLVPKGGRSKSAISMECLAIPCP